VIQPCFLTLGEVLEGIKPDIGTPPMELL